MVRLKLLHKHIHANLYHVLVTETAFSSLAKIDPSLTGKVCTLGTIETLIETSMIAKWKCDDKVTGFLYNLTGKGEERRKERERGRRWEGKRGRGEDRGGSRPKRKERDKGRDFIIAKFNF